MLTRTASRKPGRLALVALLAAAGLGLGGCFNPFSPRVADFKGQSEPAPPPNSPQGAVRLLAWCWNNRAIEEYREIFTDDYIFQFATGDSAGSLFRQPFLTRTDELTTAENLFVRGTATEPPANSISLTLDQNLLDLASTFGGNPKWHRSIRTQVELKVRTDDQELRVTGQVEFIVVRGDSAKIPVELQNRFRPDSTRWWIERWNDETLGPGGALLTDLGARSLHAARQDPQAQAGVVETSLGLLKWEWADRRR